MSITPFSGLKLHRYANRIRVCVSRVWRPLKFQSDDSYDGLHYLMIDEKGDTIHGLIQENDFKHTKHMKEGCVYDVYRVPTKIYGDLYKIVDKNIQLLFKEGCKFVLVKEDSPIPKYAFKFLDFDGLEARMKQQLDKERKEPYVLADMYSCIKQVVPEHKKFIPSKRKEESISEIFLENHRRERVKITLWGEIARNFDIKAVEDFPPPLLAVITSLRMNRFQGDITPTSTNHACVIFNPQLPETPDYEKEFSKSGDKAIIVGASKKEWKTIYDLFRLDPESCQADTILCRATVLRFPEHSGWWYKNCPTKGCSREMKNRQYDDGFDCPEHDNYRVFMTIKDGTDETATLTLLGRQAEGFFGYTCQELLNKREYKGKEDFPEEITDKVDKTFVFEVKLKPNYDLVLKNVSPHSDVVQPEKQAEIDPINEEPFSATPEKNAEKKRAANTLGKALFISDQEKKYKREGMELISSTSKQVQTDKKKME